MHRTLRALVLAAATTGSLLALAPTATFAQDDDDSTRWEYPAYVMTWDGSRSEWSYTAEDGTELVGLSQSLDQDGSAGWELVSVVPVVLDPAFDEAPVLQIVHKRVLADDTTGTGSGDDDDSDDDGADDDGDDG